METIATDPNISAETRALEEGHRAYLERDGARPRIKVVSDTHHGKDYFVTCLASEAGVGVTFTCRPEGSKAYEDDHLQIVSPDPGIAPCKHAAVAARRLEREGLLRLVYPRRGDQLSGTRWVATAKAAALVAEHRVADPFAGFPK